MTQQNEYRPIYTDILPNTPDGTAVERETPAEEVAREWRQTHVTVEPLKPTAGSYFRGILGALLGAVVGAIPWFIVSTFLNYFVGLLGFVIGLGAFFGYRLMKGARNTVFAFVAIILSSILAICLAEYADYFYRVWAYLMDSLKTEGAALTDVGFGRMFAYSASATLTVMFDSETVGSVMSNLAIGLVIGILGIITVRKYIFAYVNESGMPAAAFGASAVPVRTAAPYGSGYGFQSPNPPAMAPGSVPIPVYRAQPDTDNNTIPEMTAMADVSQPEQSYKQN